MITQNLYNCETRKIATNQSVEYFTDGTIDFSHRNFIYKENFISTVPDSYGEIILEYAYFMDVLWKKEMENLF